LTGSGVRIIGLILPPAAALTQANFPPAQRRTPRPWL